MKITQTCTDWWKCVAIFGATLCGCATPLASNQVAVTYETQPSGAMVYDTATKQAWGRAPQTRIYTLSGSTASTRVTAIWPSGANTTHRINLSTSVQRGVITLSRPMDAPGLDKDLILPQSSGGTATTCINMGMGVISCFSGN